MPRPGTGRFATFLNRYWRTESLEIGGEVSPDITPVFEITNLPEYSYLQGERICTARGTVSPGAARACGRLRNPANSGVIVVIESINGVVGAADTTLTLGIGTFAGPNPGSGRARDLRWEPGGTAALLESGTVTVLTGFGEFEKIEASATVSFFVWNHSLIIPPGSEWQWQPGADNQTLTSTVIWRERQVLPTELAP